MGYAELTPFLSSFSSTVLSELGDKTFFVTAILSMNYQMGVVFLGSYMANFIMTVLTCSLGFVLPQFLNPFVLRILACVMFFYFGLKLLRKAWVVDDDDSDEEVEAIEEVDKVKSKLSKKSESHKMLNLEVFKSAFSLNFFAEWGDKSQITTLALATNEKAQAVLIGSLFGQLVCTGLAVLGGKIIAKALSEKFLNICGGILFIAFGIHYAVGLIQYQSQFYIIVFLILNNILVNNRKTFK